MQSSFTWELFHEEDATRVALSGEITEDSDFGALLSQLSTPAVIVDLADVKRINSCGVREWINFVNALSASSHSLALERCSVAIVNQLNMISNFRGNGRVLSVLAPYFCPRCDKERSRLIDLTAGSATNIEDSIPCPTCGSAMEFDDLPEHFLSFNSQ
jgi:ABC-type transporter Mla MlaB component